MSRRTLPVILALLGLMASSVHAQLGVGLALPQRDYILYEPVMLEIALLNSSGKNIIFNEDQKWIDLEVVREKTDLISKTDRPIVDKTIYLDAASSVTLKTNVTYTHEIREPGNYEIQAKVRYKGRTYASAILPITIVNGSVQWKQRFAYTNPKSKKDEIREYELVAQKQNKGNRLVARIRDPEKRRVMCCTPVGDLMGFGAPEAKIDSGGTLHVLNQIAPKQYLYSKISPEGIRERPRFFISVTNPPSLIESAEEGILVLGGNEVGPDGKILVFNRGSSQPVRAISVTDDDVSKDRKKRDDDD
jgi:hypothetical protein